jgi:hypothetical protein
VIVEWDRDDWRAYFDERAGILEFSEGLTRQRAEMIANAEVSAERKRRRELAKAP